MRKPPSKAAPPRPRPPASRAPAAAPAPGPRAAADLLTRLTTLAQELTGAFRPATVVELLARALLELLKPDRLAVVLLDAETNRLAVTYDTDPAPRRPDHPRLQLALRRGRREARVGEDGRRHQPGHLHRGRARHRAPREPRLRRADPGARDGHPRPTLARPRAAGVGGPGGPRHRRGRADLGGDPVRRAHP